MAEITKNFSLSYRPHVRLSIKCSLLSDLLLFPPNSQGGSIKITALEDVHLFPETKTEMMEFISYFF